MRTKRYTQPHDDRRRNGPVTVTRRPDPDAWAEALAVADGDATRLTVQPDGSVLIRNRGRDRVAYDVNGRKLTTWGGRR